VYHIQREPHIVVEPMMERINVEDDILECVDKFCYLGYINYVGGGSDASSLMRVRCGRKKFREMLPLLTMKGLFLHMKGSLYTACMRSVMLYGSVMWEVNKGGYA